MSREIKYIGMDVHKEAIVIAVLRSSGKLAMESIVETKASRILQFIHGLRGELHVTWEEGTWASWLYDLLKPQVANDNSGPIVGWALRLARVRNIATCAENCNIRKSRDRFVVSIRITTTR